MTRPLLVRLSARPPTPTHRFIPASPLYRERISPCRRLTTLIRPSHPVRHFWPLRNHRFFCSRLRAGLLVERLGMQTRVTPFFFAALTVLSAKNAASAATKRGGRPSFVSWASIAGIRRSQSLGRRSYTS